MEDLTPEERQVFFKVMGKFPSSLLDLIYKYPNTEDWEVKEILVRKKPLLEIMLPKWVTEEIKDQIPEQHQLRIQKLREPTIITDEDRQRRSENMRKVAREYHGVTDKKPPGETLVTLL